MKFTKLSVSHLFALAMALLFLQTSAFAQPVMIPGFFGIESSYIEAPENDTTSTNAYLTIVNLHYEPLRLLGTSSEIFENAEFFDANNQPVEYFEVLPGERLAMRPGGMHIKLGSLDSAISAGETVDISLHVRRGREALEAVEAFDPMDNVGALTGRKPVKAGIPNEDEYVIKADIRH
tara:strand:+ start:1077 stop:1610 length:534 start_codon:yes stop_codon:yes gene_type:complete